MSRSSASATISFGLVTIPVKFYLAAASESFSFNIISLNDNRVQQKLVDVKTNEEVDRATAKSGYEYEKDSYVIFEKADLEALQGELNEVIELTEFVPTHNFEPVHVEKTYWLGPGKGSERSYRLLAQALRAENRIAIGKYYARGRDNLVALIPGEDDTLTLYQLFYANEVRKNPCEFSTKTEPDARTLDLARKLVRASATEELDINGYVDEYAERVRQYIEDKRMNRVKVSAKAETAVDGKVVDLEALLSASLDGGKKKGKTAPKKGKK